MFEIPPLTKRVISFTASGVRVTPGFPICSIFEPTFQICLCVAGVSIGEDFSKFVEDGGGVVNLASL